MTKLRVMLADDHAIVRDGLKLMIGAEPDMIVVGEATDGEIAVAQVPVLQPDVVVMDISMPHVNGIEATTQLAATVPDVKVIILSVHEESNYVRRLFGVGAKGYVIKRSAGDVLVQAIRAVAHGQLYVDPSLAPNVLLEIIAPKPRTGHPEAIELSERETAVLRLVAKGYVSKEIAAQLGLGPKTVDTYRLRAMEKLGLENRAAVVRYALEQGWFQESI